MDDPLTAANQVTASIPRVSRVVHPRQLPPANHAPFVVGLLLVLPTFLRALVLAIYRVLDDAAPGWLVDEWTDLVVAAAAVVGVITILVGVVKLPRRRD